MTNHKDLPIDRLATTDQKGNRIYLYPADVRGRFRTLRTRLGTILVVILLILPWIKVRGVQSVLLDVPNGMFAIFGVTFWAHDAPMLIFVFGGGALLLGFVTAIWGRVWCGWACPQTIFVDGVFRKIERWIEGDSIARRKLDDSPWSTKKMGLKTTKWLLFLMVSLVLSHSFLAYFVGTEALRRMVLSSPSENYGSFLMMGIFAGIILFDFGWFREQFCTLVCPYGRFQSVLMDEQSMVVAYDKKRGEPRRDKTSLNIPFGDCVNCYRCVDVCPTGIDIRRGIQLECIHCTSCMDACDEVMRRTKKPPGLIRYETISEAEGTGEAVKKKFSERWRVTVYGFLLMAFFLGGAVLIWSRKPIEITLIRASGAPYQQITKENGYNEIVNHFKIDLRNQSFQDHEVKIIVSPDWQGKGVTAVAPRPSFPLSAGESQRSDIFLRFPKQILTEGSTKIEILMQSPGASTQKKEVTLVGPYN